MSRLHNRRVRRKGQSLTDISLTPLIDTALTLLVIFMVATPMMQSSVKVNLPKGNAEQKSQSQTQDFIVSITKDNQLFFNGVAVTHDTIISVMQTALAQIPARPVFVKGDEAVSYGAIMDMVRMLEKVEGITHVALATRRL